MPLSTVPHATDLSLEQSQRLALVFKALSNPHRLVIYHRLLQQHASTFRCCLLQDLIDHLEIGAPTVSHHVKELERAGLIEVERVGRYLRCRLNESMRVHVQDFLACMTVDTP
jgi:ArsR family transcriptional regulator